MRSRQRLKGRGRCKYLAYIRGQYHASKQGLCAAFSGDSRGSWARMGKRGVARVARVDEGMMVGAGLGLSALTYA